MLLWVVKIDRNVIITAKIHEMKESRSKKRPRLVYTWLTAAVHEMVCEEEKKSKTLRQHENAWRNIVFCAGWSRLVGRMTCCVYEVNFRCEGKIFSLGKWASIGWFLYPRAAFCQKSSRPTWKVPKLLWKQSQTVRIERKSVKRKKARTFLRRKSIKHWKMEKSRRPKSRWYGTRCGWRARTKLAWRKVTNVNWYLIGFGLTESVQMWQCWATFESGFGSMFQRRLKGSLWHRLVVYFGAVNR